MDLNGFPLPIIHLMALLRGKQTGKYVLNFSTNSKRRGLPMGSQVLVVMFSRDYLGLASKGEVMAVTVF